MNMSSEKEFAEGLIFKAPRDGAPEYVKASVSIKRQELIDWLTRREGDWVNLNVKESKGGKWYAEVDNWKPEGKRQAPKAETRQSATADAFPDDSIPF